jgi:hypothetical protein
MMFWVSLLSWALAGGQARHLYPLPQIKKKQTLKNNKISKYFYQKLK